MTVPFEVSSIIEKNLGQMRGRLEREQRTRDELRGQLDAAILRVAEMDRTIYQIETWLAGGEVIDAT